MRTTARTRLVAACLVSGAVVLLASCGGGGGSSSDGLDLDEAQQGRLDAIVSVFENSTVEIQYGYVEDLGDGRGYTAGRAGFTSATGDLLDVVDRYVAAEPDAALAAFLPELERLAAAASDDTSGLDGFVAAWGAAADDPAMRQAQDDVVEDTYLGPARSTAEQLGVVQPVGLAVLYDTIVQHGDGEDPDGLGALVAETALQRGETPADAGVDEDEWLLAFLDVRREHLLDAADPDTRQAWAESVDRVDALTTLVEDGPIDLGRPFTLEVYGDAIQVP